MPEEMHRGPVVPDEEDAYRAVLHPIQWADHQNRPSTAAFDEPVFSVDIASKTNPQATVARFKMVLRLVAFNCGGARNLGFDTRDEPDANHPDNEAHAHVYFDEYDGLGKKTRKKRIRRLIEICWVVDY